MSVIDNALDKMWRGRAGGSKDLVSRTTGTSTPARLIPAAIEPAHPSRRASRIDISRLRASGYLPEAGQERRFADYYREIKRPLIQKALAAEASADLRVILVTSALPGEGKTFTTLNLALSMAREHDISVLLVDADVPMRQISRALGVPGELGLMDVLHDETKDVESLVLRTDVPGLDLLPAGDLADDATELIASARMARLATQLCVRNPRRLVLLDSPPLLVSSEARALVQVPGQVVMVARSGQTPQQALQDAVALVDKKRLSGVVLNDAPTATGRGSYYGYTYPDTQTKGR